MRIGIDARALHGPASGIGTYTRGLLDALARRDDDHEYHLYSSKSIDWSGDRRFRKRIGTGRLAWKGNLWVQTGLVRTVLDDDVKLFFGPLQVLPLAMPRKIPMVVAIHDLVHVVFPGSMDPLNYLVLKALLGRSVAKADGVITGSAYIRELLHQRLGAKQKRIEVIYHGIPEHAKLRDRGEAWESMKTYYAAQNPYILCVGMVEPRKNIITLLRAFARLVRRYHRRPLDLVFTGGMGWKTGPILRQVKALNLEERVKFKGWLEDDHLGWAYTAADLVVFPSLFEGFGFPPLEAMASGVPVIAANTSSLPEITGGAALLVPPRNPEWMAREMARALQSTPLRDNLVRLGLARAATFSWDSAAEKTHAFFQEVLNRRLEERQRRAIRWG